MAICVDHFSPKLPRSTMLIERRPSHLNKGLILVFNNAIRLRYIWRGKLMLRTQSSTKGLKMSILEFCFIVTMNHSHGILWKLILQPKNQILSMRESIILRLQEKYLRIARKGINNHQNIQLPPSE
jgi:hypothetical protein